MLCIYFEIPYERQLMRIAPREIGAVLKRISEAAEANGAVTVKFSCAAVYQFSSDAPASVFSANLFLQFLADLLNSQKKRIADYRVIIDVCTEQYTDEAVIDYFLQYKTVLIPNRGFVASAQAEQFFKPYIYFTYMPQLRLYRCTNFIVPKSNRNSAEDTAFRMYLPGSSSWFHAVYHFMLLNPVSEKEITAVLAEEEKDQYNEIKNVRTYFRRHRFCTEYPAYFTDAWLRYTEIYFRAFMKQNRGCPLAVYTGKNTTAIQQLVSITGAAVITGKKPAPVNINALPADFAQLVYLTLFAAQFIFEDEIPDFFASMHKNSTFIGSLYEWMYAFGITEIKNNIYSADSSVITALAQQIGDKKTELHTIIAQFLWEKYKSGALCPDAYLKNVFSQLTFSPNEHFILHAFFYEHHDAEILQADIRPFKSAVFFTALENYQKALKLSREKYTDEALSAVKNALTAIQKQSCTAGEYRILSCIALLHLSQNKVEDAISYLHYALDNAEALHDARFICETLFNLSAGYFLQNNLTAAVNHLNRLQHTISGYFEQSHRIPCIFMQGRVALQLGDYNQAECLFEAAADTAAAYYTQWEPLCRVWYARTAAYKGQTGKAQNILLSYIDTVPDAALFLIESLLLSPVIREELLHSELPLLHKMRYEPYQSGFALAEELIWGKLYGNSALHMFYTAAESYYRLRCAAASISADDRVKDLLQKLEETAREALRHQDMYAALYLYFCYDSFVRLEGPASDHANGYLSRAFKALQNNMKSITENSIRDKFILRNVWNARLYAAAQKNKLI